MPDYRTLYDKDYIYAYDLAGKDATLVISKVEGCELKSGKGTTKKPVIFFRGQTKGLALNSTNGKIICKLYGPKTEDWIGKALTLYPTTTSFGNETVECIRVRPTRPVAAQPTAQPALNPVLHATGTSVGKSLVNAQVSEPIKSGPANAQ